MAVGWRSGAQGTSAKVGGLPGVASQLGGGTPMETRHVGGGMGGQQRWEDFAHSEAGGHPRGVQKQIQMFWSTGEMAGLQTPTPGVGSRVPELPGLGEAWRLTKKCQSLETSDRRLRGERNIPGAGVGDRMPGSWRAGGRDMPPRPPGPD